MAVKYLQNQNRVLIERVSKQAAIEASGLYDLFTRDGVVGYRRKSYKAFLKEAVSTIMIVARERALAWEKHVGLHIRD